MWTLYFAVIIAITAGHPILEEEDDTLTPNKIYHDLGGEVLLSWEITKPYVMIYVKLPIRYSWLALGFHEGTDYEDTGLLNNLAFVRIRTKFNRLVFSVKNADWTSKGFSRSKYRGWQKENMYKEEEFYHLSISRPLKGFQWDTSTKMTYGFGIERSLSKINSAFDKSKKTVHILSMDPVPVTTTTTTLPSTDSSVTTMDNVDVVSSSTNLSMIMKQTEMIKTPLPTIKTITLKNLVDATLEKPSNMSSNTTTPCPVKCNCTNTVTNDSHWFSILRAKENTMYFAIIGSAALFTGLIVLCIACCCARGNKKIPRTRKHKVAFYKVDDFDSDADEEMEFIDSDKDQK